jgi:hypothetical protein
MKNVKSLLTIATVITVLGTAALAQHKHEPKMGTHAMQKMKDMMQGGRCRFHQGIQRGAYEDDARHAPDLHE